MPLGAKPTDDQLAEIDAMMESFIQAVTAADWDTFIEHYTDDTVVMPPNSPPLIGKEAVRGVGRGYASCHPVRGKQC